MNRSKKNPSDGSEATGPRANAAAPEFEKSLAELERIVAELESGQLTLAQSIERYEKGVTLLRKSHAALDGARVKIELLTGVREDGSLETEPFPDNDPESPSRKTPARENRQKSQPRDENADLDDRKRLF